MCMFAIGIMKSLTFHCTRPGGRTPAPNSPRSRIWPVDRMMRLQTVAVSSAALPRDHWTPDTLCDRNSCHGYSIHCPNNRMFHLKWRILDCHSNWLTISISQNEYLCFWHVKCQGGAGMWWDKGSFKLSSSQESSVMTFLFPKTKAGLRCGGVTFCPCRGDAKRDLSLNILTKDSASDTVIKYISFINLQIKEYKSKI